MEAGDAGSDDTLMTAFVLLTEAKVLAAEAWLEELGKRDVEATAAKVDEQITSVELSDGSSAFFMMIDAPHPDVLATDPDPATVPPAHAIIHLMGSQERSQEENDHLMARIAAAAVAASPAVAAMLGCGIVFRRADVFVQYVDHMGSMLSALVFVDVTVEQEADGRFSVLTHGLTRYAREEFMIVGADASAAYNFAITMAQWMLDDRSKVLPTGDTVGRSAEEQLRIERVPSPLGGQAPVIRLELPSE